MPDSAELVAIKNLTDKVIGMRNTLFGKDDQGGMVLILADLKSTVYGVSSSADDRGLIGDVKDTKQVLEGTPDTPGVCSWLKQLDTDMKDVKKKQNIWNKSLSGAQILAWIGLALRFFKSG